VPFDETNGRPSRRPSRNVLGGALGTGATSRVALQATEAGALESCSLEHVQPDWNPAGLMGFASLNPSYGFAPGPREGWIERRRNPSENALGELKRYAVDRS